MRRLYFLSVFLSLTNFTWAEIYTITVDKAVEMAITNNLKIKQAGIALKTKKTALDSSFNVFIPSLDITASFNGSQQLSTDVANKGPKNLSEPGALSASIGGSLNLPISASSFTAIQILKEDYKAGLISYEKAEKKLARDVRKMFYSILGNQKNIDIQESNIDLAQKRLERERNNFSLGLKAELDVLSAEVNLGKLIPKYNSVLTKQQHQRAEFKFLIGLNQEDEMILDGELVNRFYNLDSKELINKYISRRLSILELTHKILKLKKQRTSHLLYSRTPSLNLGYNYQFSITNSETSATGEHSDPWSNGNDRGTLTISLKWNLDGFIPYSKKDVKSRKLKDKIDEAILSREIAREKAIIEIANLVNKLNTAQRNIESNEKIVTQAERKYALTDEAYNVGSKDFLDVETAQNNLLSANQELVLARYKYIEGLLDLEYALNADQGELPVLKN